MAEAHEPMYPQLASHVPEDRHPEHCSDGRRADDPCYDASVADRGRVR